MAAITTRPLRRAADLPCRRMALLPLAPSLRGPPPRVMGRSPPTLTAATASNRQETVAVQRRPWAAWLDAGAPVPPHRRTASLKMVGRTSHSIILRPPQTASPTWPPFPPHAPCRPGARPDRCPGGLGLAPATVATSAGCHGASPESSIRHWHLSSAANAAAAAGAVLPGKQAAALGSVACGVATLTDEHPDYILTHPDNDRRKETMRGAQDNTGTATGDPLSFIRGARDGLSLGGEPLLRERGTPPRLAKLSLDVIAGKCCAVQPTLLSARNVNRWRATAFIAADEPVRSTAASAVVQRGERLPRQHEGGWVGQGMAQEAT